MESLKVTMRIRPEDLSDTERSCLEVNDSKVEITKLKDKDGTFEKGSSFTFDRIFDSNSTQEDVFEEVRPLIHDSLSGFTVTVFAFGMTGSGKTHTISGDSKNPGIVPRTIDYIFDALHERASVSEEVAMVSLTYIELYNNSLYDLLDPNGFQTQSIDSKDHNNNIKIHCDHPTQGVTLTGSPGIRTPVSSPQEAMALIAKGNKLRATSRTKLNERSSRGHTVITLEILTKDMGNSNNNSNNNNNSGNNGAAVSIGKINLVDLAGSERVKLSGAEGQTLQEAKQINKALSVLGDVLNGLSKYHQELSAIDNNNNNSNNNSNSNSNSKPALPHIPYRNSKLTMLLKDSLGGSSKTMMVATVRSSATHYQQTMTSARYAARARHIKNVPFQRKEISGTADVDTIKTTLDEVSRLRSQLEARSKEYEDLCQQLAQLKEENKNKDTDNSNDLCISNGTNNESNETGINDSVTETSIGNSSSTIASNKEKEDAFLQRLEQIRITNESEKAELQEHTKRLILGHESQMAQKQSLWSKQQSELQERLNSYDMQLSTLQKDRKNAIVQQKRTEYTNVELVRKVTERQQDVTRLEREVEILKKTLRDQLKIHKQLQIQLKTQAEQHEVEMNEKERNHEEERLKLVGALQKLMDSRERNKARIESLSKSLSHLENEKQQELELAIQGEKEKEKEKQNQMEKVNEMMELELKQEAPKEELVESIKNIAIDSQNDKEEEEESKKAVPSSNTVDVNLNIDTDDIQAHRSEEASTLPPPPPPSHTTTTTTTTESTAVFSSGGDLLSPKTKTILDMKTKIKTMTEAESGVLDQMEARLDDLQCARTKLQKLQSHWNSEYSSLTAATIAGENEVDALRRQLFKAESKIGELESDLAKAYTRIDSMTHVINSRDAANDAEREVAKVQQKHLENARRDRMQGLREVQLLLKQAKVSQNKNDKNEKKKEKLKKNKSTTNNNINTDNDDDMYDLNNIINLNKMMESNDNII